MAEISHFPAKQATRQSDQPVPGFYLLKPARGGVWVGAVIEFKDGEWSVTVDGDRQGPSKNPWILPLLVQVHHYGQFSTESEVAFRIGRSRWARIHAPSSPEANPRRPIDLDAVVPF